MLVLSRYANESIHIGDDIIVTVLDIRHGSHIRIGIEAPKDVIVHRHEVWESIQRGEVRKPKPEPEPPSNANAEPPADASAEPAEGGCP